MGPMNPTHRTASRAVAVKRGPSGGGTVRAGGTTRSHVVASCAVEVGDAGGVARADVELVPLDRPSRAGEVHRRAGGVEHGRGAMGEPICRTLSEHGLPIDHCRPTTPFARPSGRPSCSARSISATKSVGACGEHRPLRGTPRCGVRSPGARLRGPLHDRAADARARAYRSTTPCRVRSTRTDHPAPELTPSRRPNSAAWTTTPMAGSRPAVAHTAPPGRRVSTGRPSPSRLRRRCHGRDEGRAIIGPTGQAGVGRFVSAVSAAACSAAKARASAFA